MDFLPHHLVQRIIHQTVSGHFAQALEVGRDQPQPVMAATRGRAGVAGVQMRIIVYQTISRRYRRLQQRVDTFNAARSGSSI